MMTDSGLENLGCFDVPDVGDEAVNAEVQATSLMMKNLCKSRIKIHTERDRHNFLCLFKIMNNNYNNNSK
mgnify:CR=1 FL=1